MIISNERKNMNLIRYILNAIFLCCTSTTFGMQISMSDLNNTDWSIAQVFMARQAYRSLIEVARTMSRQGAANQSMLRCLGYQIRHLEKELRMRDPEFQRPKKKRGTSSPRISNPAKLFSKPFSYFEHDFMGKNGAHAKTAVPFSCFQYTPGGLKYYDCFGHRLLLDPKNL